MSENIHIKRRQRKRNKPLLTTRNIVTLIILSAGVYAGFRFWVGDPDAGTCVEDCESMYSLTAWVLGFGMMFAAVIAAGAVIGIAIALLRRRSKSDLSALLHAQEKREEDTIGGNHD